MIKILVFIVLGYLLYRMVIQPALAPPKDEANYKDKIIIDKNRHKTTGKSSKDDYVDYEEIDD